MATVTRINKNSVTADDLHPVLGERCALKPRHFMVCLFFSAVFLLVNTLPLLDWTVWSDVRVGRWILDHGTLPVSDPAQPLSEGMRVVHTGWLSQLLLALADRLEGPQGVANLGTMLTMAYLAILARVVYGQTAGETRGGPLSGSMSDGMAPQGKKHAPADVEKAPRPLRAGLHLGPAGRVGLMLCGVALCLIIGPSGLFTSAEAFGKLCFTLLLGLLLTVQEYCNRHSRPAKRESMVQFLRHSVASSGFSGRANKPARLAWPTRAWERLFGRRITRKQIVPRMVWPATAGLFALWANLHGSYMLGIAVLTVYALVRACEVAWREKGFRPVFADSPFRTYLLLTATALGASLLNPYGPRLALANLAFLHTELRMAMPHWHPLNPASAQGVVFLASLSVLALLLLVSGRRMHLIDLALPAAFGAAVFATQRAQSWYALVYVFVAMPHVVQIGARVYGWIAVVTGKRSWFSRQARKRDLSVRRSIAELGMPLPAAAGTGATPHTPKRLRARDFIFTLLCGLTLYCAFCLAPGTQTLLGGSRRPEEELLGSDDLWHAAEWIRESASGAFVYASPDWSDFLVGRAGEGVTAMMTSNVQWVPHDVRTHHQRMGRGDPGWEEAIDHYGVDTLVLDPDRHGALIRAARRSPLWTVPYRTNHIFIACRVAPDG